MNTTPEVSEALGSRLLNGLFYSLTTMATIFVVLALIWGILTVFNLLFARKEREEAAAERPQETPAQSPALPAEDDAAVLAAITAAIACILEEEARAKEREPGSFRVVSFKRSGAWDSKSGNN